MEEVLEAYNRLMVKEERACVELDCVEGQEMFRIYAKLLHKLMDVVVIVI